MISLQTNVDSLIAQRNLNVDNQFQSTTIQQLTSGYRINSSGNDAAGLAIANGYRSSIAELSQGVANANDGNSQLQIIDGGLNNISTILNRLKTLATQSASGTFAGDRSTLNQEYSELLTEIDRQAANVNLNVGGSFNTLLSVYVGGATLATNAVVTIDLSGADSAVDTASLGLQSTNVLNGGVSVTGNTKRIDAPGAGFVVGTAGTNDQTFTFNVYSNGGSQKLTATVPATTAGSTEAQVLSVLNGQLNKYGITAGVDGNGLLQFSGSTAFSLVDNSGTGANLLTNDGVLSGATTYTTPAGNQTLTITNAKGVTSVVTLATTDNTVAKALAKINAQTSTTGISAVANAAGTGINFVGAGSYSVTASGTDVFGSAGTYNTVVPGGGASENTSNYIIDGQQNYVPGAQTLNFETSNGKATVTIPASDTEGAAIADINAQTVPLGVYAVVGANGGISFQGSSSFAINATGTGVFAAAGYQTSAAPTTGTTNNGTAAINSIDTAIKTLGLVQGRVGAGENLLQYAISLAQSQISSFSAAQSQIRDANVAEQAANLTKAQVLTQTSVAALAQANAEPQSVLKLLQG